MAKCDGANANPAFQELATQSLDTATYLDTTPYAYASHVRDFLDVLKPYGKEEEKDDEEEKKEQ
jgi:hypothetical protein